MFLVQDPIYTDPMSFILTHSYTNVFLFDVQVLTLLQPVVKYMWLFISVIFHYTPSL